MTINDLKEFLDKTITVHMTDGEVAKVKVCFVDDEYNDLVVDVLETSSPERLPLAKCSVCPNILEAGNTAVSHPEQFQARH